MVPKLVWHIANVLYLLFQSIWHRFIICLNTYMVVFTKQYTSNFILLQINSSSGGRYTPQKHKCLGSFIFVVKDKRNMHMADEDLKDK